jgi:hypothetical protein
MASSDDTKCTSQFRIPPISELPLSASDLRLLTEWSLLRPAERASRIQTRGSWSPDEDDRLLQAASDQTTIAWDVVAGHVGTRTPKQCRERWLVKLNPDVRRSPFQQWEDNLIQFQRQRIGNHWSVIAQMLPGRTACSVKNRWYTVLRYKPPPVRYFPITLAQRKI